MSTLSGRLLSGCAPGMALCLAASDLATPSRYCRAQIFPPQEFWSFVVSARLLKIETPSYLVPLSRSSATADDESRKSVCFTEASVVYYWFVYEVVE